MRQEEDFKLLINKAKLLLDISQNKLADLLEVSEPTLKRLKGSLRGKVSTQTRELVRTRLNQLIEDNKDNISDKPIEKVGKVERKPKYRLKGDTYIIYYGKNKVKVNKDKLKEIRMHYCTGKFTIEQTALEFNLLREELIAIKTAFGFVKSSIPYSDEDIDNNEVEDLVEIARIKKKKLYFKTLDENKVKDMERELKKFNTQDYFLRELLKEIREIKPLDSIKFVEVKEENNETEGFIHLTDFHYGSNIDIIGNQYNPTIADSRILELFNKSEEVFRNMNISKITILFTGDMSNVMIHKDKQLSQSKSRAVNMVHLSNTLSDAIRSNFIKKGYKVSIGGILGNESRLSDEFSAIDKWATDSFDYIMYQMLKMKLSDTPNITFINDCDKLQEVVRVGNVNIALLHGDNIKGDITKAVNEIKLKWFYRDIKVDYALFGHIHSTLITNAYARGGSLVGGDSYSEHKLNISKSYPSQNIGWVNGNKIYITPVTLINK